jgi:hypothetical protein
MIVGVLATLACFHRAGHTPHIGEQVSPPIGLDSVGTARWIAQQRAACPGTLRFLVERSSRGRRSDNEMQATQFFYWRNSGSEWPEDEVRDVFQAGCGRSTGAQSS